jgi:gliding motility-associated-like protein
MYNTIPGDQPPDNQEWIELYNPSPCHSIDISCYTIGGNMLEIDAGGNNSPNWGAFTFPSGTIIPPLGFITIGGNHSQVPILDFNITNYRQTTYGVQYLDGDLNRWFLRDEYGWIALYNPNGNVIDAVYWDAYGMASNLYSATQYQQDIVTRTSCNGTQTLAAARNIPGIEYLGACSPSSNLSFQRTSDGASTWFTGPVTPTPHVCNGPCVVAPQLSHTIHNESCAGGDGSITLTITDGHSGPYTTNWINPAGIHSNTLSNLSAGVYIVQVVDFSGCLIVYDTITITAIPDPVITFSNVNPETCNMNNGSVQTVVTNGNNPINYVWNTTPASNTPNLSNLNAGSYSVSITDNLGCTASNTVNILDLPGPQVQIDSIHNEMCSASNGAVHLHINGGTLPLNFIWNSNPPQQTQNLTGMIAGDYSVTISDANGCKAYADTSLTNTPPPVIVLDKIQSDTCNKRVGSIHVLASGGNPPYIYNWSSSLTDNLDHISHLAQGNYTVSVSDNFCMVTASAHIDNFPGPKADFQFQPPVALIEDPVFSFEDLSTGIIDHWIWDFGDMMYSSDQNPTHSYNSVGNYDVMLKITNDNGCVDSVIKKAYVVDRPALYVPNCFTPNGDGVNDYFFAAGINITDFTMYIFDRWGELVFSSHSINDHWDGRYKGKFVSQGIYDYVLYYNENYAGVMIIPKTKKGSIAVII